jgi:hypothetical protein
MELHSPSTMPHFGQSITCTNTPLSCAPKVNVGAVLHVEHAKRVVPVSGLHPGQVLFNHKITISASTIVS